MPYKPQHLKYDVKAVMRRFRVQVIVLTMAVLLALTAAVALAEQTDLPGKGNPVVNPAGHCPKGQQPADAPPGATAGNKC